MNYFSKLRDTWLRKAGIATSSDIQALKTGIASSSDIQALVNFIDFRFIENSELATMRNISAQQGRSLRALVGHNNLNISISASKPVAFDSLDHKHPWGTKNDNSVNLAFNKALFEVIPPDQLRCLDLGCSGGGFVRSLHDQGALAVGIEGSDYSKIRGRAEWSVIPHRLFTADITAPFTLSSDNRPISFNVVTAWEFMEHIAESNLPAVFDNIKRHLTKGGLVIMSISPKDDWVDGVNLHRTVRPPQWWFEEFKNAGFTQQPELLRHFMPDKWIRHEANAAGSFHVVAKYA